MDSINRNFTLKGAERFNWLSMVVKKFIESCRTEFEFAKSVCVTNGSRGRWRPNPKYGQDQREETFY